MFGVFRSDVHALRNEFRKSGRRTFCRFRTETAADPIGFYGRANFGGVVLRAGDKKKKNVLRVSIGEYTNSFVRTLLGTQNGGRFRDVLRVSSFVNVTARAHTRSDRFFVFDSIINGGKKPGPR